MHCKIEAAGPEMHNSQGFFILVVKIPRLNICFLFFPVYAQLQLALAGHATEAYAASSKFLPARHRLRLGFRHNQPASIPLKTTATMVSCAL
jgi:hypothetical protein